MRILHLLERASKPVAASRSRDGSASFEMGCWLLQAEVLNFPIKTSLAGTFSLRHWGGVREGDLGHEVDKSVVSLRERARGVEVADALAACQLSPEEIVFSSSNSHSHTPIPPRPF